jgi:hypothetical protein
VSPGEEVPLTAVVEDSEWLPFLVAAVLFALWARGRSDRIMARAIWVAPVLPLVVYPLLAFPVRLMHGHGWSAGLDSALFVLRETVLARGYAAVILTLSYLYVLLAWRSFKGIRRLWTRKARAR